MKAVWKENKTWLFITAVYLSFPIWVDSVVLLGLTGIIPHFVSIIILLIIGVLLFYIYTSISKNSSLAIGLLLFFPILFFATYGAFFKTAEASLVNFQMLDLPLMHLIKGSRNMYYISCIGILFSVLVGSMITLAHFSKKLRSVAALISQLLASVPQLFSLVLIFGVYNFMITSHLQSHGSSSSIGLVVAGLSIGLVLAPSVAGILISRMEQLKNQDFVKALRASGISNIQIMAYNLLWRNCRDDILTQCSYQFGYAIILEVSLMFIYNIGFANLGTISYDSLGGLIAAESGTILLGGGFKNIVSATTLIICSYLAANLVGDGFQTMSHRLRRG